MTRGAQFRWTFLAVATVLAAGAAVAAAAEGGEESVTQTERWYNAAWAIGLFGLLLLVLGRFAWKPIIKTLQDREQVISAIVSEAERRLKESQELLAEYQARLASAQAEAKEALNKAKTESLALREDILKKARDDAAGAVGQAQRNIEQAKRQALNEIYQTTAELATSVAAKIIHKELNPEDHRRLVQESLDRLGQAQN